MNRYALAPADRAVPRRPERCGSADEAQRGGETCECRGPTRAAGENR
ncbi:MAG: hypothetical protein UZ13_02085 [Chloroflexi bacterium OLB13]|nr:MAG: hypothetical protein UZ13_02085 [Chloroflexi bacterium OLB13]